MGRFSIRYAKNSLFEVGDILCVADYFRLVHKNIMAYKLFKEPTLQSKKLNERLPRTLNCKIYVT